MILGVKHFFKEFVNLRVKFYIDNQAVVALLNYGVSRCPFLANCLREISFYLAKYNIELKAQYIRSKDNCIADCLSRAFSNEVHFRNFNKLLDKKLIILDVCNYNDFNFKLDL